jgi:quinolinate synthase
MPQRAGPYNPGRRISHAQVALPVALAEAGREETQERIAAARAALGRRVVILGHHYQRDEVIRHADFTGDSFKLAQLAATRPESDYIVFCGVHFMAESADILSAEHQQVILPDLTAGCTMADMARRTRWTSAGTT